ADTQSFSLSNGFHRTFTTASAATGAARRTSTLQLVALAKAGEMVSAVSPGPGLRGARNQTAASASSFGSVVTGPPTVAATASIAFASSSSAGTSFDQW